MPQSPTEPDPKPDPGGLDEATIAAKIEAKVAELFASRQPAPAPASPAPPTPPTATTPATTAPAESIEARIAAAVDAAFKRRDSEDQQYVLAQEVEKIKAEFSKLSGPRKKSWGAFLVGPW